MIRIQVNKKELEDFIDSLENDFKTISWESIKINWITYSMITFLEFKEVFCNDKISFFKSESEKVYRYLYDKISWKPSWNYEFLVKIKSFIIEKFTKEIRFCPYCWKVPLIHYWKDLKKERLFQFDHFFPKNYYHKWIINFYNLIPSCNACNHLKWENNPLDLIINWWTIFHPYFWNIYLDEKKELKRDFQKNADIKLNYVSKNSKFFKLAQKYLNSQDTFNDFNFILEKREKMKDLKLSFKNKKGNSTLSDEKLKNYFFESYYPKNEEDVLKYWNWKLKKDLIENLKI